MIDDPFDVLSGVEHGAGLVIRPARQERVESTPLALVASQWSTERSQPRSTGGHTYYVFQGTMISAGSTGSAVVLVRKISALSGYSRKQNRDERARVLTGTQSPCPGTNAHQFAWKRRRRILAVG